MFIPFLDLSQNRKYPGMVNTEDGFQEIRLGKLDFLFFFKESTLI